jgi:hypothetical protein
MNNRRCLFSVAAAAALVLGSAVSAQQPKAATVTGNVVDVACFMIHPGAAEAPSHKECAAACVARGVPVAIANEADGQLYFPADQKQLQPYRDKRVTAAGTFVRKDEPLELKMPVGDKNEMSVKVTGGYNVLTIEKVIAAPKTGNPR